ncbi:MAG: glycerol-3-phosphate dehydrogenase, partial [Polyangiaceae bacterium]|nr:glycerol-3-phosphate dehydrogenase [Polyangiaceae bacterium]
IFIAAPSAYVRQIASSLGAHLDGSHLLVHVSRGLADPGLTTLTQVLREVTPCRRVGALAGPLVAESLRSGAHGGAIVGTLFPEVAVAVREAIGGPVLRIEHSSDVLGVELASAVVGVLSVGAGYAQAIEMGPSALAVLLTRGMREGAEIGKSLGADYLTFAGLAGMADLVAAVAPDHRPETALGVALARGGTIHEAARVAGAHIEGVTMAQRIVEYAGKWGIETPVLGALARVFQGSLSPDKAVAELMAPQSGKR